jgi:hypothetical protein
MEVYELECFHTELTLVDAIGNPVSNFAVTLNTDVGFSACQIESLLESVAIP